MLSNGHHIEEELFNLSNAAFEKLALEIFLFQFRENKIYRQFCTSLQVEPLHVKSIESIPFLPIRFFKNKEIVSGNFSPAVIFESSGTTGSVNSRHRLKDISIYEKSFLKSFELQYGDIKDYCILGLLPSYLEKGNSSLVYMVNDLINLSENKSSGFYLKNFEALHQALLKNETAGIKTILIGVTYALLDFAENFPLKLRHTIIMETGGMKGRREELTREEVHDILKKRTGLQVIHSEYGMTELLSQAYSPGNGIFSCPPWMKVLLRAEDDPFQIFSAAFMNEKMQAGIINIIDLANIYSCSFIATDDVGKLYPDETFEVMGRLDNSDIRGCGLMLL